MALVEHRMKNYEDALWSGVGMIHASNGQIDFDRWQAYAESIDVTRKYPGINGIGVIHSVNDDQLDLYLAEQRIQQPGFHVHPDHTHDEHFPISYVVPVAGNEQAVGLDIAYEPNRRIAAKRAGESGTAQITGPITLVQDNSKTAGFLFYAPFYSERDVTERDKKDVAGLVYAPFVVKKLMDGVLERDRRHVGIQLMDEDQVLYDEHVATETDFDPSPLFSRLEKIELYGRTWTFDIRSAMSFRDSSHSSQPIMILLGGIVIDCMLIALFVSISRSSSKALGYADSMTVQLEASQNLLEARAKQLENSNQKLQQFAFIASHDLQEPLRKVASFCNLIREEYGSRLDQDGNRYLQFAVDGATRMRSLIQDLLQYSKFGCESRPLAVVDATTAVEQAASNLEFSITQSDATVTYCQLPNVWAHERELVRLFQNLIGNGLRYRSEANPAVHVSVVEQDDCWEFSVSDNGIGIAPEYRKQVFGIFKRLHSRKNSNGNGIGLAICKRIVDAWGGEIWIATSDCPGCNVCFTVPKPDVPPSQWPNISKQKKGAIHEPLTANV
jgi:signal transduction histidine kinase